MPYSRFVLVIPLLAAAGTLDAQSPPSHYEFDVAQSQLYVVTHRSGIFAGLFGHEHVIMPRTWSGEFCWSPTAASSAQGMVRVDARSLEIDVDSARRLAGLGGGPSEGQLKTIREKFTDEHHLDVAHYPEMRIELTAAKAEADQLQTHGRLTIRQVTRDAAVSLRIEAAAEERVRVTAKLSVRQSDFGIKPDAIAGVVKVKDAVDIHFTGVARPTAGSCPLPGINR